MDVRNVSVILLAGGIGTRMKMAIPKQYLTLCNKPVVRYSFDLFMSLPQIAELIVVCDPEYQHLFEHTNPKVRLAFAPSGKRRQDSMWNGLENVSSTAELVCIHDSARPMIDEELVQRVLLAGHQYGAATVGMPIKFTLKENDDKGFVKKTVDRSKIWEIQTPQVLKRQILIEGFQRVQKEGKEVTDDVSLAEILQLPVKLVEGSYMNLKITTPEDLFIAEYFLRERRAQL